MRDLTKLLHPFPSAVVHNNPGGGGTYVKHSTVQQRLLDVLGYPPDTELVQVIRGDAPGKGGETLSGVVVGVVMRMRCTIDGQPVTVEEAGDCELPSNWKHDGARMKDAMSDAYKRCAMRLGGVGLHLWSQGDFYLAEKMLKQDQEAEA